MAAPPVMRRPIDDLYTRYSEWYDRKERQPTVPDPKPEGWIDFSGLRDSVSLGWAESVKTGLFEARYPEFFNWQPVQATFAFPRINFGQTWISNNSPPTLVTDLFLVPIVKRNAVHPTVTRRPTVFVAPSVTLAPPVTSDAILPPAPGEVTCPVGQQAASANQKAGPVRQQIAPVRRQARSTGQDTQPTEPQAPSARELTRSARQQEVLLRTQPALRGPTLPARQQSRLTRRQEPPPAKQRAAPVRRQAPLSRPTDANSTLSRSNRSNKAIADVSSSSNAQAPSSSSDDPLLAVLGNIVSDRQFQRRLKEQQASTSSSGQPQLTQRLRKAQPFHTFSPGSRRKRRSPSFDVAEDEGVSTAATTEMRKKPRTEARSSSDQDGQMATTASIEIPKIKTGNWSNNETTALELVLRDIRDEEEQQRIPAKETKKDTALWDEASKRLLDAHNIERSGAACKSHWSRVGREKSGFDERFKKNPGQLTTCVQKPKRQGGKS